MILSLFYETSRFSYSFLSKTNFLLQCVSCKLLCNTKNVWLKTRKALYSHRIRSAIASGLNLSIYWKILYFTLFLIRTLYIICPEQFILLFFMSDVRTIEFIDERPCKRFHIGNAVSQWIQQIQQFIFIKVFPAQIVHWNQ